MTISIDQDGDKGLPNLTFDQAKWSRELTEFVANVPGKTCLVSIWDFLGNFGCFVYDHAIFKVQRIVGIQDGAEANIIAAICMRVLLLIYAENGQNFMTDLRSMNLKSVILNILSNFSLRIFPFKSQFCFPK